MKKFAFRFAVISLCALFFICAGTPGQQAQAATKKKSKSSSHSSGGIKTLYKNAETGEFIRQGNRGIIVSRDSLGVVRAMNTCTVNPNAGRKYSEAISEYAARLAGDGVRVYQLIAPTQGEFYMPEMVSTIGAEQRAIERTASFLTDAVTPVFVIDTLRNHMEEDIYNRTDHHWAPLGAYYAAKAFAKVAGVPFRPLSDYTPREVKDYVGTMYKFSGDPEVKNYPETFVYYMPPEGYEAEFITYKLSNNKTVGESEPHKDNFFRHFNDGSGAAYSTFMGGDTRTVKVTNTGGPKGRKLLIVKDSYGNAVASNLFGSFEEVHVIDFRYFPHNLVKYVKDQGITDLVFINTIQLAMAPNTATRLQTMLNK